MAIVNHVGLAVTDVERSRRFYEEVLGFEWDRDLHPPDDLTSRLLRVVEPVGVTACYLKRDGFVLELLHFDRHGNDPRRERSFTEPGLTHLSFAVDDVPTTCRLATEHGGEVLTDTDLGGMAIMIRDPDGQLLELLPMSYRTG
jgi:lactoylglutathione lyase